MSGHQHGGEQPPAFEVHTSAPASVRNEIDLQRGKADAFRTERDKLRQELSDTRTLLHRAQLDVRVMEASVLDVRVTVARLGVERDQALAQLAEVSQQRDHWYAEAQQNALTLREVRLQLDEVRRERDGLLDAAATARGEP